MAYWTNEEDVTNDIFSLSDICACPEPAPPPSEFMKKLRGKRSIFEDDFEEDKPAQSPQCVPVRGHPLLRDRMRKPGGTPAINQRETETLLREVSGFGYGNDLIEHAFKRPHYNSDDEKGPQKMLTFDLSSGRKLNVRKSGEESDSSTNTTSEEYMTYNEPNSSDCVKGPDIHSRKEFPDLK